MSDHSRFEVGELSVRARLAAGGWKALWIEGDPSALEGRLVALVGTRDTDPVGYGIARQLAADLADAGVCVVSGGALGIDTAAHQGAVSVRGRSVVVLPSGLEHWYPRRNDRLFRAVIAHGGALVSQFPPETPPTEWTFPRRNELLAAMADVLVVVQAPVNSGALMAAEFARKMGRRVMAVPASPREARGAGCLRLLRAGARPCMTADDILAALAQPDGELFAHAQKKRRASPRASERAGAANPSLETPRASTRARREAEANEALGSLDEGARLVYHSLASVPRHVDELTRLTGLNTSELQQSLLTLVLCGLCDDRGGGNFVRP